MKDNNSLSTKNSEYVECNQTQQIGKELSAFNNKCRICLDAADIPIFGDELTPDISNDIETFGSIEIRNDDDLTKYICESCEKLLQAAVFFRKTAQQTDLQLKSQQLQKDANTTNNVSETVKPEGFDREEIIVEVETENSPSYVKEEIVIEPFFIFEELSSKNTLNDITSAKEFDDNHILPIVEDNNVSLSSHQKYACKLCDIHFKTAKAYSKHKKTPEHKKSKQAHSNKIECEICFKNISRAFYNRHMEAHSNDKDDKLTCPICDKSFGKSYFNYHITHTHNKDDKKESERIQCSVCNKLYEKHYYKFHLAIHNNDSSRYICDTCGKSFIQQSAFKRHSLIHGSELAYQCKLCPYKGRHPGLLKTHMQTHTRDYQHRCMECPARFLTKSNLNKHLQRHKGPVDFKCETCKRGFYSKPELERHFEADHLGVKNHVCNICGKAFGYRNAMMSHQLKVHKRAKLTNGKGRRPLYLADRNNEECE